MTKATVVILIIRGRTGLYYIRSGTKYTDITVQDLLLRFAV